MASPPRTRGRKGRTAPARNGRAARRVIGREPALHGWQTTDEQEIERRRWRGLTEIDVVETIEALDAHHGRFRVRSSAGGSYEVEIRSLREPLNSCGCTDHRVNGLGTCKHIEGAMAKLRKRGVRAFDAAGRAGSPRVELFLRHDGERRPALLWPQDKASARKVRLALAPFLAEDATLADPTADGVAALLGAIGDLPSAVRDAVRVSWHLEPWLAEQRRHAARTERRKAFLADVDAGRQAIEVLRHPLLPYQREGMLHLAFGERALLADEMGLGKTIQAIAACELLRRLQGVSRVLVVCPASLKAEWEEQIARFSGLPTRLVIGARAQRLALYQQPAFFTVVNYEQVISDAADINRLMRPDIVVLDEAQRIKNWHTKTAHAVKSLAAPYAFVLTGTPLENRIDEVYSIVQYLDQDLLGPLFRFNRDFYQLDAQGRPTDYKNLDELARRLRPIMLRRRKRDVETELPARTVSNYMVGMTEEQQARYDEYYRLASRLIKIAERRPLTPEEFKRLQQLLACMRMVCDTPYILDEGCRDSPKLEELERILAEVLAEPDRKVIVFSEWERMLMLARELAGEMGVEAAWHTGSVPQLRRRAEINRFKKDPQCRLLLSTDSGSVGLNLQAASVVINLDLPWNPARLEQRIARAWRKNQPRTVDVVNLVTENSIEHNILHVLAQKQALADGVLDGDGDLGALRMPSGRRAFVERMASMMAPQASREAAPPAPQAGLQDGMLARHGAALLLLRAQRGADGREQLLAVIDGGPDTIEKERRHLEQVRQNGDSDATRIEVIDRGTWETIERLQAAGLVGGCDPERRDLVRSPLLAAAEDVRQERLRQRAKLLGDAERKLRMALLLTQGGFEEEATPILAESRALAAAADAVMHDGGTGATASGEAAEAPAGELAGPVPGTAPALAGAIELSLAKIRDSVRAAA